MVSALDGQLATRGFTRLSTRARGGEVAVDGVRRGMAAQASTDSKCAGELVPIQAASARARRRSRHLRVDASPGVGVHVRVFRRRPCRDVTQRVTFCFKHAFTEPEAPTLAMAVVAATRSRARRVWIEQRVEAQGACLAPAAPSSS